MTASEMARNYFCYAVWALVVACRTTTAFNVDLSTASLRQGAADSMFGFTVAQHVDHGQNWSVHRLRAWCPVLNILKVFTREINRFIIKIND